MRLLAIDTSSASTVVAASDGARLTERRHDPSGRERPAHTTLALELARECLDELGLDWGSLERIGTGVGPGSFTGLRSGLSAAAGLARRLDLPLIGLTATALLAAGAEAGDQSVLAVVDGRRSELFVEAFRGGRAIAPGEDWAGSGPTVLRRADVASMPRLDGWIVVGDGALLEADAFRGLGGEVPEPSDRRHRISGGALVALTASGHGQRADAVRPAYGRAADAVPTAQRGAARFDVAEAGR